MGKLRKARRVAGPSPELAYSEKLRGGRAQLLEFHGAIRHKKLVRLNDHCRTGKVPKRVAVEQVELAPFDVDKHEG
jgi:hypothetical protein